MYIAHFPNSYTIITKTYISFLGHCLYHFEICSNRLYIMLFRDPVLLLHPFNDYYRDFIVI